MPTARCVSEIHAFPLNKEDLRFSSFDCSLTIRTQVGFLVINQLPSKAPDCINIPRMSNICRRNDFNLFLSPVRAVTIYLKRTSMRGSRTRPSSCVLLEQLKFILKRTKSARGSRTRHHFHKRKS